MENVDLNMDDDSTKDSIKDVLKYPCERCNFVAKRIDLLNRHEKSVHNGALRICNFCDFQCGRTDSLKRHIKAVHEKIKIKCDLGKGSIKKKKKNLEFSRFSGWVGLEKSIFKI